MVFLWLSWLGVVPFVVGTALAWSVPPVWQPVALHGVHVYAAVILSFLGAVHWGRVLGNAVRWQGGGAAAITPEEDHWLLVGAVGSVVAWLALLIPAPWTALLLSVAFAGLALLDHWAAGRGLLPDWYGLLRLRLSTLVCLCLLFTLPLTF